MVNAKAGEAARYREAAALVGRWLGHVAVRDDAGASWVARPGIDEEAVPSLGWGSLGPVLFFADFHRTLGDPESLKLAKEGAAWMAARLRQDHGDLPPGLFTGLAGFAVVFNELQRVGLSYGEELKLVLDGLEQRASNVDTGVHWLETTEVLWGTAGIGFVLLTIGAEVCGGRAVEVAARAGDWLLSVAEPVGDGLRWGLGDGVTANHPILRDIWFPNFSHGTAGIAAFLARLATATGDSRYLEASKRAANWVLTTCRTEDGTCAAWHHEPGSFGGDLPLGPRRSDGESGPLYTLGWCHGPPGLGWFFRELEIATGERHWGDWVARTAAAVRRSGIPERLEPGFWDNVGRCCGSAGVVEYFLDLHTWRGYPDDLDFASHVAADLLERATVDQAGMRWSNVEIREEPPDLPPETTFFQGASGIGSTLLRLARHLEGDTSVTTWPHAPHWQPS